MKTTLFVLMTLITSSFAMAAAPKCTFDVQNSKGISFSTVLDLTTVMHPNADIPAHIYNGVIAGAVISVINSDGHYFASILNGSKHVEAAIESGDLDLTLESVTTKYNLHCDAYIY